MFTLLLRPVRQLAQAFTANESPRQIALGFALGMVAGMMPKSYLLTMFLATLIFALRVNQPAGLLGLWVFSYIGPHWDGFAHRVGELILGWDRAHDFYTWLYELPLGPYLGYHNTVVIGQLLIGIYFFYPIYHVSKVIAARIQPPLRKWLMGYRVIRWLRGAEFGAQWGLEG